MTRTERDRVRRQAQADRESGKRWKAQQWTNDVAATERAISGKTPGELGVEAAREDAVFLGLWEKHLAEGATFDPRQRSDGLGFVVKVMVESSVPIMDGPASLVVNGETPSEAMELVADHMRQLQSVAGWKATEIRKVFGQVLWARALD